MDFWTHLLNIISHKVDVILHQISSFAIAGNFKMTAHIALVEHFSNRSRCVQIKIVFFNFQIDSWVRVYWKENNENTYYNHLGRTKIFSIKNSIRKQTLMPLLAIVLSLLVYLWIVFGCCQHNFPSHLDRVIALSHSHLILFFYFHRWFFSYFVRRSIRMVINSACVCVCVFSGPRGHDKAKFKSFYWNSLGTSDVFIAYCVLSFVWATRTWINYSSSVIYVKLSRRRKH